MNTDQVKKLTDNALEELTNALNSGKSEALTCYLSTMARFHRYSFGNILLIMLQKPDASHVAGFNTWRKLSRFVRKGEKGIAIFAPMLLRAREENETESADDNAGKIHRFRVVHVFDISQTEGEPLPEPTSVSGDPRGATESLLAFAAKRGIKIAYAESLGGALGMASAEGITLRTGQGPAAEFATLAHELAHMLLHIGDDADRPASKTVRETEAEAVAFVVCQAAGLSAATAASDYIQLYQGDVDVLAASMERIRMTASVLISAVMDSPAMDESLAA